MIINGIYSNVRQYPVELFAFIIITQYYLSSIYLYILAKSVLLQNFIVLIRIDKSDFISQCTQWCVDSHVYCCHLRFSLKIYILHKTRWLIFLSSIRRSTACFIYSEIYIYEFQLKIRNMQSYFDNSLTNTYPTLKVISYHFSKLNVHANQDCCKSEALTKNLNIAIFVTAVAKR